MRTGPFAPMFSIIKFDFHLHRTAYAHTTFEFTSISNHQLTMNSERVHADDGERTINLTDTLTVPDDLFWRIVNAATHSETMKGNPVEIRPSTDGYTDAHLELEVQQERADTTDQRIKSGSGERPVNLGSNVRRQFDNLQNIFQTILLRSDKYSDYEIGEDIQPLSLQAALRIAFAWGVGNKRFQILHRSGHSFTR